MSLVITEFVDQVGTITMNNGARRNAFNPAFIADITAALHDFRERRALAIVLRSTPRCKVWSAGHDINELPKAGRDPLGWGDALRVIVRAIREYPAPVIALIEGGVWGGACEVAMACDIAIATPEVTFAITPAKLGIPYNLSGILTLLNVVPLPVAKEMLFTAEPIPVQRALALGIVNHVVPPEEIDATVRHLTDRITRNAPLSISVMKEELRLLAGAHPLTPELFEKIQGLRRTVYDSHDYEEGIRAFHEKRKPNFSGR